MQPTWARICETLPIRRDMSLRIERQKSQHRSTSYSDMKNLENLLDKEKLETNKTNRAQSNQTRDFVRKLIGLKHDRTRTSGLVIIKIRKLQTSVFFPSFPCHVGLININ